jgi:hypothetical protein
MGTQELSPRIQLTCWTTHRETNRDGFSGHYTQTPSGEKGMYFIYCQKYMSLTIWAVAWLDGRRWRERQRCGSPNCMPRA